MLAEEYDADDEGSSRTGMEGSEGVRWQSLRARCQVSEAHWKQNAVVQGISVIMRQWARHEAAEWDGLAAGEKVPDILMEKIRFVTEVWMRGLEVSGRFRIFLRWRRRSFKKKKKKHKKDKGVSEKAVDARALCMEIRSVCSGVRSVLSHIMEGRDTLNATVYHRFVFVRFPAAAPRGK